MVLMTWSRRLLLPLMDDDDIETLVACLYLGLRLRFEGDPAHLIVTPQIVPQFIGYAIYRLDVSIRSATVLGLVGAGGLGFSLIQNMKLFKYHQTATCILVIFLLVLISDWICGKLRRQVI